MNRQHVQIPNKTTENITSENKNLNKKHYTDLLIYACLKKYMDKDSGTSRVGLRKISEETTFSLTKVQAAIKRLEDSGDIEKSKDPNKNMNIYKFNKNSEKFEMFGKEFLENVELTPYQKSFFITTQKYLYIDPKYGIGKTTYSSAELSEKTGLSEKVIKARLQELEEKGFISRRLTQDIAGNSCEALEFNLPKFGQYILCKINEHDKDIIKLKEENASLKSELTKVKYMVNKISKYVMPDITDNTDIIL
jgi:DNA-binding MarR family transcriptional regulator